MKKILIIWALSKELNIIKSNIKNKKNLEIKYLVLWIWNYETIYKLTKYLEKETPDFIINIWICWYKKNKKDFIQVWKIFNEQTKKELIVPIFIDFWNISSISTSEKIIEKTSLISENYVDMESYWIEFIASKYKIPRVILKIPVDKIWKETKNFDYKKALNLLEKNIDINPVIERITTYLDKLPTKKDYNYIKKFYRFTFQEFEIFKQKIQKYEVVSWKEFEKFFEKNKKLNKKEFIELLSKI